MKMNRFFYFIIIVILILSCRKQATEPDGYESYEWPLSSPEAQGFDPHLFENALTEIRSQLYLVSFLVVRNGCLVAEEYFNWDRNDGYDIRSATKSIVSGLVGIAIKEGFIDSLDQPMIDFYPEYNTPSLDPKKREITIRHLLMMKAGFDRDANVDPIISESSNWIREIIRLPLVNDPGETFTYSTMGAHLLSGIITKATHMSTRSFSETYLCNPLDISIRYWDQDPQGIYFGGGSMYMTSRDLARFGYLYLNGGEANGDQFFTDDWIEASFQNHIDETWEWGVVENMGYGFLWWLGSIGGYEIRYAFGYAGQSVILFPELNMVIVTTCMFPFTGEMADEQAQSIFELIANYIIPAVTG